MQPRSQRSSNIHKGPSTSKEFNDIRENMYYDLLELYSIAEAHDEEIKSNMDTLITENHFMQNKIIDLEKKVRKIESDLMYAEQGLNKQSLIKSFYSLEGLYDGDLKKQSYINTMYGYLSLPPSDIVSKISYKNDAGNVMIPDSLEVQIFESHNAQPIDEETGLREYYVVEDENVKLAFDRDRNSVWRRTATFPGDSGVSEVYGILHIKLPLDVINNVYANTLTINPFPEFSMTIRDIQYKGYGKQWYRLENYPTEKDDENIEQPVEIQKSGKMIFSFPKTEVVELQIFFTQPYWCENEVNRDFVYGFQEIELEHRIYNDVTSEIVSEFSLEKTTKGFQNIEKPTIVPLVGTPQEIEDLVQHKLYYNKELTNEFTFGNEIMAPIQKVYVKTIFKGSGEIIPFIKEVVLNYNYKDLEQY